MRRNRWLNRVVGIAVPSLLLLLALCILVRADTLLLSWCSYARDRNRNKHVHCIPFRMLYSTCGVDYVIRKGTPTEVRVPFCLSPRCLIMRPAVQQATSALCADAIRYLASQANVRPMMYWIAEHRPLFVIYLL